MPVLHIIDGNNIPSSYSIKKCYILPIEYKSNPNCDGDDLVRDISSFQLCTKSCDTNENDNYQLNPKIDEIDGTELQYLLKELHISSNFRRTIIRRMRKVNKPVILKVVPPEREGIDYKGNQIAQDKMMERIELENMMSWLSTLGGAFSALGDSIRDCAEVAGKISNQQISIAINHGDPITIAQCYLYLAISLIQKNQFRLAKKVIREQYKIAVENKEHSDKRLMKMCCGIWAKWQYNYLRYKQHIDDVNK